MVALPGLHVTRAVEEAQLPGVFQGPGDPRGRGVAEGPRVLERTCRMASFCLGSEPSDSKRQSRGPGTTG